VGDEIAYRIEDGRVVLTKAVAADSEDPFASFTEWDSAADHAAYGDL
jgi:antitoxin PrlF